MSRLQGPRLILSDLNYANLYTHYDWNNDPELNRLDSERPFQPEALGEFKARFERMVFHPSETAVDFEVHHVEHGLVGVAYFEAIDAAHRHARFGVTIGARALWGQGLGREAVELLLAYGFGTLGLHRVTADAFAFNGAWKRVLHRCGFRQEGCLREFIYRDGRYWDKEQFGLLQTEYQGLRARAA